MAKTINVIEPIRSETIRIKRVAAYARVSTDTERLMHSLSAQISYYSDLIQKTPGWQYVGVYADEGITGTKATIRDEFQRLLDDCEAGKIDIVLTKSISRFARNTIDLLESVRRLKEYGVEVRFEKENISTLTADGELLLTLLASFAQEEIRSLSQNVRWGVQKRFKQGIPNNHFRILGYRWEGDQLVIEPEEAAIVRRIFQNFLDGKSRLETEREFAAEGITTKGGYRFVDSNIKVILTNITYTGCMLFQKEFIDDPITKKRKKNHGEMEQYFVEDTHEPIIDKETFAFVQAEIARRKELGPRANKSLNLTCFSSIIKCACHGCSFVHNTRKNRAKVTDLGERYITWSCDVRKNKGGLCDVKTIPEYLLKKFCAEALGLSAFDEDTFTERVKRIELSAPRHMKFFFNDGTTYETDWVSTAKKDWWTPERRSAISQKRRSPVDNPYKKYPFSRFIHCAVCGQAYTRDVRKTTQGDKPVWFTYHKNDSCPVHGIPEKMIESMCAEVMELSEFSEEEFYRQLHHADVLSANEVRFVFRDGSEKIATYQVRRQGTKHTDEWKQKMSDVMKERWQRFHEYEKSQNHSGDTEPIHRSTDS